MPDGLGAQGVDGGQGEREPGGRGDGGSGRGADPYGRQRQDHRLGPWRAADPGGGVGEDHAVLLAVPRQGPQCGESPAALVAAQRGDRRGGVAGRDLAQVIVAPGPLFQERVHAAEVDADGVGAAGQGPGRSMLQGACPAAGAGGDARCQRGELAPRSTCPEAGRGRRRAARRRRGSRRCGRRSGRGAAVPAPGMTRGSSRRGRERRA